MTIVGSMLLSPFVPTGFFLYFISCRKPQSLQDSPHKCVAPYRNALAPFRLSSVPFIADGLFNPPSVPVAKMLIFVKTTTGDKLTTANQRISFRWTLYPVCIPRVPKWMDVTRHHSSPCSGRYRPGSEENARQTLSLSHDICLPKRPPFGPSSD